jgi:predicted amidophosphoribosyltransferase
MGHGAGCCGPAAWSQGDALWDYRGGRPALGALLVPAIKRGELGWKAALLERAGRAALPDFAWAADLVCAAPTSWPRRWLRGFDLAEEAAALFARRLGKPYRALLRKAWFAAAQAGLGEGRRRRLPASALALRRGRRLEGESVLLVDDVWTTGTTLLRCAQALQRAGAGDVAVLTLFRAQ